MHIITHGGATPPPARAIRRSRSARRTSASLGVAALTFLAAISLDAPAARAQTVEEDPTAELDVSTTDSAEVEQGSDSTAGADDSELADTAGAADTEPTDTEPTDTEPTGTEPTDDESIESYNSDSVAKATGGVVVSGEILVDANNDETFESSQSPLTIQLIDTATDTIVATTNLDLSTDAYQFTGVGIGDFTIKPVLATQSLYSAAEADNTPDGQINVTTNATTDITGQYFHLASQTLSSDTSSDNPFSSPVTIDVLANDHYTGTPTGLTLNNGGTPTTSLTVPNEGTWTVNPSTFAVTFTPEAAVVGNPSPISYAVDLPNAITAGASTATIEVTYTLPDPPDFESSFRAPAGRTVIYPLEGDQGGWDPSTLGLVMFDGRVVPGFGSSETGTWNANWPGETGGIRFTPNSSFTGDSASIEYQVKSYGCANNTHCRTGTGTATFNFWTTFSSVSASDATQGTVVTIARSDYDLGGTIPSGTVQIVGSDQQQHTTYTVAGEGTWSADPTTGDISFTPQTGFSADPTPIGFTVDNPNETGPSSYYSTATITYISTLPDPPDVSAPAIKPGTQSFIYPLANDPGNWDESTVTMIRSGTSTATSFGSSRTGGWSVIYTDGGPSIRFTPIENFSETSASVDYQVSAAVCANDTVCRTGSGTVTFNFWESFDAVSVLSTPGSTVTIDRSDYSLGGTIPSGLVQVEAADGQLQASSVVPGEGTWTANPTTGSLTFTPEAGFTGKTTPVGFTVDDPSQTDPKRYYSTATIDYINPLHTPTATGTVTSTAVTIDPLAGHTGLDPTSVRLTDPSTDERVTTLTVWGEGTWAVDPTSGAITFTPQADSLYNPIPVKFTVYDQSAPDPKLYTSTATINYATPLNTPTVTGVIPNRTTYINPLDINSDLDTSTLKLLHPDTGARITTHTITGEGTWRVRSARIEFRPETGSTSNPTPIDYAILDSTSPNPILHHSTITIEYANVLNTPDITAAIPGETVTINPLAGHTGLDPTNVRILYTWDGKTTTSLYSGDQGNWSVDTTTGLISFRPFTTLVGDPTPGEFLIGNLNDDDVNYTTLTIEYANALNTPDITEVIPGETVTINPLAGHTGLDPTTVKLTDPDTSQPVTTLTITGEGTWAVDTTSGEITFTPEAGFTSDPTPVDYTVGNLNDDDINYSTATIDYATTLNTPTVSDIPHGTTITIDPLAGHTGLDPTTVKLTDPDTGQPVTTLTITGQGTWSVDTTSGEITFTPEAGFTSDPTPVDYTVGNLNDDNINYSTATINYATPLNTPTVTGVIPNRTTYINPLDINSDLDTSTLKLLHPDTGARITTHTITGEGTWRVRSARIEFRPETGSTSNPTPIDYAILDSTSPNPILHHSTITIEYANVLNTPDITAAIPGETVTINPLAGHTGLDPTNVRILYTWDGKTTTSLYSGDQGNWSVDTTTGLISFRPFTTLVGDPTPGEFLIGNLNDDDVNYTTLTIEYANALNTPDITEVIPGETVTINPLAGHTGLDPTTVKLTDPDTSQPVTTLTITGEGTWAVDTTSGEITFTPEAGFTSDPTPVDYTVGNLNDDDINYSTATIDYATTLNTPTVSDIPHGTTITIDPLAGHTGLDPTSVQLTNPDTGQPVTTLTITGQGTWSVDTTSGEITFTPEAGFTSDPTPVDYTVGNLNDDNINYSTATINYATPLNTPTVTGVIPNRTTYINPLDINSDLDTSTLKLLHPDTGARITTHTITGEGTWRVRSARIEFRPETGSTSNPTPIDYAILDSTSPNPILHHSTITIEYANVLNTPDITAAIPGETVTINPLAGHTGLDPTNVRILYTWDGKTTTSLYSGDQGNWSVDTTTGLISFRPFTTLVGDPTPGEFLIGNLNDDDVNYTTLTIEYANALNTPDITEVIPGETVTINPLAGHTGLDPTTVKLTDPDTSQPVTTLTITGEGTWAVDTTSGEITFTPEAGFTSDPTPVDYTVGNLNDDDINYSTATIDYATTLNTPTVSDIPHGTTITIDPLAGHTGLDPTTVKLTDPDTGQPVTTLTITGQGTWSVDTTSGEITFTPEAGFTSDPTPVGYTISNLNDDNINYSTATINYATPLNTPTVTGVIPNRTTYINPLDINSDLDTSTLKLLHPDTGARITTHTITGEGTWRVRSARIEFRPETGSTSNPTPIDYAILDSTSPNPILHHSTITIEYANVLNTPDITAAIPGETVTINPLAGHTGLDPTSVRILYTWDGKTTTSLYSGDQGNWSADTTTGLISFRPFTTLVGDPTPGEFLIGNLNDDDVNYTTLTIEYANALNTPDITEVIPGETVTINPLAGHTGLDPTTVKLTDPDTGQPVTTLTITGEGTWAVDTTSGEITFTPEAGFTSDPTPVDYTVGNLNDDDINYSTATIDYATTLNTPTVSDIPHGTTITIDPLAGHTGLDPTTVKLTNPDTGQPVTTLTITGQGTWSVDTTSGEITFTPEAGFTSDPTPVGYTISNLNDDNINYSTATINYPDVLDTPAVTGAVPLLPVTINPLAGHTGLDPTSVRLTNPDTGAPTTTLAGGEGTWTVDPSTGEITFTPRTGSTSNPTPVDYTIGNLNDDDINYSTVAINYAPRFNYPTFAGLRPGSVLTIGLDYWSSALHDLTAPIWLYDLDDPSELVTSLVISGEGTWSVDQDTEEISFTPAPGFSGRSTKIGYAATQHASTNPELFYAQTAAMYGTTMSALTVTGVQPGTDATLNPLGINPNLDPDTVRFHNSLGHRRYGLSMNVSAEGTWTISETSGVITFTPETGFTGDPTPVEFSAYDFAAPDPLLHYSTATIDYATVLDTPVVTYAAPGQPVTIDPLAGHTGLDPTRVQLTDPDTGQPVTTLTITGQGTWSVDTTSGEITFTPEAGFTSDPTPVGYTVGNLNDDNINYSTATINYPDVLDTPSVVTGAAPGSPATIDPLADDDTLDPTTVRLINPDTGAPTTTLTVTNEGTWTVDTTTGLITFTPETGFTGDPTPVGYTIGNLNDDGVNYSTATINYPDVLDTPIVDNAAPGSPATINPLAGHTGLDPSSVQLTNPDTGQPVTTLTVTNEGTWTVDTTSGEITFTPETGFTGDPTPVGYTIGNLNDDGVNYSTATINYATTLDPLVATGAAPGSPATINPLADDDTLDPTTVRLINPDTGAPTTTLTITGEGAWTADTTSGEITFTPETGFTSDPTPVGYTIGNLNDDNINYSTATINYPDVLDTPSVVTGAAPGSPATIDPLADDDTLDPTTVRLINPDTSQPVTTLTVTNEGTWTVDTTTGLITFAPETGFTGDPTPVGYTIGNLNDDNINYSTATINYPDVLDTPSVATGSAPGSPATIGPLADDDTLDPTTVRLIDPDTSQPVTTLSVTNEGTWTADTTSGEITFAPETGFTGDPTPVGYTIGNLNDDNINYSTATINYPDVLDTPIVDNAAPGSPATINPLAGHTGLDPTSVQLTDPSTGAPTTTLTITGEGTWTVDTTSGEITFTPETGFTSDPTPVGYTVGNLNDDNINYSTATINYPDVLDTPIVDNAAPGSPATIDPLADDDTLDPTTVRLINPDTGQPVTTLSVTNEGTWTVDTTSGEITFTPETGFTGDPTPVGYTIGNLNDDNINYSTATINYATTLDTPIVDNAAPGSPATINPLAGHTGLDPSSVQLTNPDTGQPVTTLTITGEGTWTVDTTSGQITFTPETGFTSDPTPVGYTIGNLNDDNINYSTATINYATTLDPLVVTGAVPGSIVTINPLANDNGTLDPTTVKLIDPDTGAPTTTLTITGEGTWTADTSTGLITFTPAATASTVDRAAMFVAFAQQSGTSGDPTPVAFTIGNLNDDGVNYSTATINYATSIDTPTVTGAVPGSTVTIDPLANDNGTLNPSSVRIVNPTTGVTSFTLATPGEGVWTTNPTTGEITFTPDLGFTGDPTSIGYTIDNLNDDGVNYSTASIDYNDIANDDSSMYPPTRESSPRKPGQFVETEPLYGDPGIWDPASLRLIGPDGTTAQTVSITNVGVWLINTANNTIVFAPDPAFTGTSASITYEADTTNCSTDPDCITNQATITANYWPTFTTPTITGVTPGSSATIERDHYDSSGAYDPTTISFDGPTGSFEASATIPGEGTWTTTAPGDIVFTPEPGFTANPTPIGFAVFTSPDYELHYSTASIIYTTPMEIAPVRAATPGAPATIDPVAGDGTLDPASVRLIDPNTGQSATTLAVSGEGTWTVNPTTGEITFTPDTGFTGDPAPIDYIIDNLDQTSSFAATATIDYPAIANDDPGTTPTTTTPTTTTPTTTTPTTTTPTTTTPTTTTPTTTTPTTTTPTTTTPTAGTDSTTTPTATTPTTAAPTTGTDSTDQVSQGTSPVTINPLLNDDRSLDPGTVRLVDPSSGQEVLSLAVEGEGTWSVDPTTGTITFTPEPGFTGHPTPIDYTVATVLSDTLARRVPKTPADGSATGQLAFTGTSPTSLLWLAMLLTLLGACLIALRNRCSPTKVASSPTRFVTTGQPRLSADKHRRVRLLLQHRQLRRQDRSPASQVRPDAARKSASDKFERH